MNNLLNGDMFALLCAAVIGGSLLILGVKVFGGGLLTAFQVLSGRWRPQAISGTVTSLGRIKPLSSNLLYYNMRFISVDEARNFTCARMLVGRVSYFSGMVGVGFRGGWLVDGVRLMNRRVGKVKLLGFTNGQHIYHSASDLAEMFHLATIYPLIAGVIGLALSYLTLVMNAFHWPLPVFVQDWAGIIAIACGLFPSALLMLIYKLALNKMAAANMEALNLLAIQVREMKWKSGVEVSTPLAMEWKSGTKVSAPLAADDNNMGDFLGLIGFFSPLSLVVIPLSWLAKGLIWLSAVFAAPRFELRRMTITGSGDLMLGFSGRLAFNDLNLKDHRSGEEKKAHWVLVAEIILNNGLPIEGSEGYWLLPNGFWDRFSDGQVMRGLVLAGFQDEARGLVYDPDDILKLYRYTPLSPYLAALAGLAIGAGLLEFQTGQALSWPGVLWLLPAAVLPYSLLVAAKKRILSAAEEVLKGHCPAYFLSSPDQRRGHGS